MSTSKKGKVAKWLTLALALVGVVTQLGVLPPAVGPAVQGALAGALDAL